MDVTPCEHFPQPQVDVESSNDRMAAALGQSLENPVI
jgi:hypothetical protein